MYFNFKKVFEMKKVNTVEARHNAVRYTAISDLTRGKICPRKKKIIFMINFEFKLPVKYNEGLAVRVVLCISIFQLTI